MVYDVRGEHPTVYWTSPANAACGRPVAKTWATRMDDFTHDFTPQPTASGQPRTPVDLHIGTRGEYTEWIIETRIGPRLGVCVHREPYRDLVRPELERLRTTYPDLKFTAVRETTVRTEEDW